MGYTINECITLKSTYTVLVFITRRKIVYVVFDLTFSG